MNRGLSEVILKNQQVQAKDSAVCNEVCTSVEEFKKFVSEQKKYREELINLSYNTLLSLKDDLNTVSQQVSLAVSNLRHISTSVARLKTDVLKEEKNVGVAHKTSEYGSNMRIESSDLSSYFNKKVADFEVRMRMYKQELEAFEENVFSQSITPLTPRDLLNVLNRMDHDFINLAAQLYTAHETIKGLKTEYLKKYKTYYGSNRNPFGDGENTYMNIDASSLSSELYTRKKNPALSTPYGPSPFSIKSDNSLSFSVSDKPALASLSLLSSISTTTSQQMGFNLSNSGSIAHQSATTSTSFFKPFAFGMSTSSGSNIFGQSTSNLSNLNGLGTIDSIFGKRFAS